MPEIGLDEADRCPYCDKILSLPPDCCEQAKQDEEQAWQEGWAELHKRVFELDEPTANYWWAE